MATLYDLKPRFQQLLRPYVAKVAAAGVTANQMTIAAVLLCLIMGAIIMAWGFANRWLLILVPFVLAARLALNVVDGMLAREHNQASRLGSILNEAGDVLADGVVYLPVALAVFSPVWGGVVVIVGITAELIGVMGNQFGAGRRYDGPLGKPERVVLFGVMALLIGIGVPTGVWVDLVFVVALLAGLWTLVNRTRGALGTATTTTTTTTSPTATDV